MNLIISDCREVIRVVTPRPCPRGLGMKVANITKNTRFGAFFPNEDDSLIRIHARIGTSSWDRIYADLKKITFEFDKEAIKWQGKELPFERDNAPSGVIVIRDSQIILVQFEDDGFPTSEVFPLNSVRLD
jgi:hypothetical protein